MGTGWGNTSVPGEYATHKGKCPQAHLLHVRLAIRVGLSLFMNLVLGIDVHGDSQKLLVEERNTSFYTKRHGRCNITPRSSLVSPQREVSFRNPSPFQDGPTTLTLVGSQTITDVQALDPLDTLLVEDLRSGRSVEIKVSSENLIGTFSGQDHLDSAGLDLSAV